MRPQPGTAAGRWGLPGAPPQSEQERAVGEARGGRGGRGRESSQDVRFCAGSGFHCEAWELRVASPDLQGRESRGLGVGPSGRKVPWRALGEALRVRAGGPAEGPGLLAPSLVIHPQNLGWP